MADRSTTDWARWLVAGACVAAAGFTTTWSAPVGVIPAGSPGIDPYSDAIAYQTFPIGALAPYLVLAALLVWRAQTRRRLPAWVRWPAATMGAWLGALNLATGVRATYVVIAGGASFPALWPVDLLLFASAGLAALVAAALLVGRDRSIAWVGLTTSSLLVPGCVVVPMAMVISFGEPAPGWGRVTVAVLGAGVAVSALSLRGPWMRPSIEPSPVRRSVAVATAWLSGGFAAVFVSVLGMVGYATDPGLPSLAGLVGWLSPGALLALLGAAVWAADRALTPVERGPGQEARTVHEA